MSSMDQCACGMPGRSDDRDGDDVVRCVLCRREWRRLRVSDAGPPRFIGDHRGPGRQSGDPFESSPSRRLQVQARAVAELLVNVQRRLPAGLAILDELEVDGYPTRTPGASDVGTVVPVPPDGPCVERSCGEQRPCPEHDGPVRLTSVEAAVVAGSRAAGARRQLDRSMKAMAANALRMVRVLEQLTPPEPVQLCNRGTGRDGVIEWGDPLCERHLDPTKAGMCDRCWAAEAAWREAHDLPPRKRTGRPMPSGPLCIEPGCEREATPGRTDGLCNAHRVAASRAKRRAGR